MIEPSLARQPGEQARRFYSTPAETLYPVSTSPKTLILIAAVFSIPAGFGITLATLRVTGGLRIDLALLAGGTVALGLAVLIVLIGLTGSPEPNAEEY